MVCFKLKMICCCLLQLPLTCPWCFFLFAWYFRHRVFHIYIHTFLFRGMRVCRLIVKGFFYTPQRILLKEKICLHAERIPIDRLRWHHIECAMHIFFSAIFCFYWVDKQFFVVPHPPRRLACHFKHFIGFWNSNCIRFVNINSMNACTIYNPIASLGWHERHRLAIT